MKWNRRAAGAQPIRVRCRLMRRKAAETFDHFGCLSRMDAIDAFQLPRTTTSHKLNTFDRTENAGEYLSAGSWAIILAIYWCCRHVAARPRCNRFASTLNASAHRNVASQRSQYHTEWHQCRRSRRECSRSRMIPLDRVIECAIVSCFAIRLPAPRYFIDETIEQVVT